MCNAPATALLVSKRQAGVAIRLIQTFDFVLQNYRRRLCILTTAVSVLMTLTVN